MQQTHWLAVRLGIFAAIFATAFVSGVGAAHADPSSDPTSSLIQTEVTASDPTTTVTSDPVDPPSEQPIEQPVDGPDLTLPETGGAPGCGNTVYLAAIQYTHLPVETGGLVNGADFKVVGVNLDKWLGTAGTGILDVWVVDYKGTHHKGKFNASGQWGARTAVLHGAFNPVDPLSVDIQVHAYILKNGTTKCQTRLIIQAPGTGGAV